MNKIVSSKLSPVNVVYVNGVPYFIQGGVARRLGSKGEIIKFAAISKDFFHDSPKGQGIYKIVDGKLYFGTPQRGDYKFEMKQEGVVGAIIGGQEGDIKIYTQDGNKKYLRLGVASSVPVEKGIKGFYPLGKGEACLITDMAGDILYDSWDTGYLPLPGTNLKKYSYHKPQATFKNLSPPPEELVILTSGGLLLPSVTESNSMDFAKDYSFLGGKGLSSKGTYAHQIPLPDGVRPDDIQDIKNFSRNNIYLLDNQGRVFVIGKNEHGQRGTSKDIPTSEWNQIEYPEPIKQIETLNVPGIFALSENGNLYYHGYNEKGYYKITGKNSDITSPVKVLDNVSSLWIFNDSPIIEHKGYVLQILPEEQGTLKHIPGATLPVVLLDNMRESLVYTKGVLNTLLNHWCHE